MEPQLHGAAAAWSRSCMELQLQLHGAAAAWSHSCMEPQLHGATAAVKKKNNLHSNSINESRNIIKPTTP
jgi:hypothetical protein